MNIRLAFENDIRTRAARDFFQFRKGGHVVRESYGEAGVRVRRIAELSRSLGIEPRKAPAAIILENSSVWIETYLAHACTAIPVVPVDPKLHAEEIAYMMADASVGLIYTDVKHIPVLEQFAPGLDALKAIVFVDGKKSPIPAEIGGKPCYDLETKMKELAAAAAAGTSAYATATVADGDLASIIYTSGTTGKPKGALITHGNFCADIEGGLKLFPQITEEDNFFTVLPLFHAFSFCANFIAPLMVGATVSFAQSLRTIPDDMRTFRPTMMMAVPLMVEKMHDKIVAGIKASFAAKLLIAVGLRFIVVNNIRKTFGGRIRALIVGGAPCSAKLLKSMRRLKMPVIEGYGLTECAPIVSVSPMNNVHVGTIGLPLPNIEVRLGDMNEKNGVGELQVRGPVVMQGYHNKPEATAATFTKDGWLRTGDLASQDADGYLTIRGRVKSLIVNREGKNIYPEEVESAIGRDPHIRDIVVVGYSDAECVVDGDKVGEKVGVIVVPDEELYSSENGGKLPPWDAIEESMRKIVKKAATSLADYKHPRKIAVYKEPLQRTSTLKVRRYVYQGKLDE